MRTYILNLYYPKLTEYKTTVTKIKDEIIKLSGSDWRVLSAGEQICSIGFATDKDPKTFSNLFGEYGQEHFHMLLVEISAVHAGWIDKSVYEWLGGRLRRG